MTNDMPELLPCREAFEKWMSEKHPTPMAVKAMQNAVEEIRWQAWQAAWNNRADLSQPKQTESVQDVDLDNAREVFEDWITASGNYPHLKHKSFGGNYLHEETAMKWDGFKAGYYAQPKQEPVGDVGEVIKWLDDAFADIADSREHMGKSNDVLDRCERVLNTIRALTHAPAPVVKGWMPIETAPEGKNILVWYKGGVEVAWRYGEAWQIDTKRIDAPTHWMPLPPAPHNNQQKRMGVSDG